jgi:hypothetical protein
MQELFQDNPRDYALYLVEEQHTTENNLLIACLKYMSHDQIRDMLEENELGSDFLEGYCGEEEISKEERFACEMYNERYSYCD